MKITLSDNSTLAAVKDQVSADLGEETTILHLKSGVYYGLNEVGARIWNFIQVPRRVKDIRDFILEEYDVPPRQCEKDILTLLQHLLKEQLVGVQEKKNS